MNATDTTTKGEMSMNASETLVWEEPKRTARVSPWMERLTPVTERPGSWARVAIAKDKNRAQQTVVTLRKRSVKIPDGSWEFSWGEVEGGGVGIYARYMK